MSFRQAKPCKMHISVTSVFGTRPKLGSTASLASTYKVGAVCGGWSACQSHPITVEHVNKPQEMAGCLTGVQCARWLPSLVIQPRLLKLYLYRPVLPCFLAAKLQYLQALARYDPRHGNQRRESEPACVMTLQKYIFWCVLHS